MILRRILYNCYNELKGIIAKFLMALTVNVSKENDGETLIRKAMTKLAKLSLRQVSICLRKQHICFRTCVNYIVLIENGIIS